MNNVAKPVFHTSLVIAAFSTVVEWYDFTLYLYLATVVSRVFFGGGSQSLNITLASFAVAYLMRPLGAAFFGYVGDRYGRRTSMILSMLLVTMAMMLTALLPTYAQVGPSAGYLLIAMRCLMGFSVGGEYNAVVAYLIEGSPTQKRGLMTSLASAASELGGLCAAGVSAITVSMLAPSELERWGFRVPFLVGGILAAFILVARLRMQESREFLRQKERNSVPSNPLTHALRSHLPAIWRGFAISALGSITFYVGITYIPTYVTEVGGMQESRGLWLSTAAAWVAILVTPLCGSLSDRFGRKSMLLILCLMALCLTVPMFYLLASRVAWHVYAGAFVLAAIGGGISAVGAVATAEQFEGEGRLSGLALGASSATALFGGLTPYASQKLLETTGVLVAPGLLIAVTAAFLLPILLSLQETCPNLKKTA